MRMIKDVFSTVFLFILCWSVPVLGGENKLLLETRPPAVKPPENRTKCTPENGNDCPLPDTHASGCEEWVQKYGYKCTDHKVTTKDGYILGMQRIAAANSSDGDTKKNPPVLLQHGILMDGVAWMLLEKDSLAFVLADNGFDVWIANNRGTRYSRGHKRYPVGDQKYWDWSWQELSEFDLDATVGHVHETTGKKVHYVGHSMGTAVMLIALASHQPTINKLSSAALLCPIGYMSFVTSVYSRFAANFFVPEIMNTTHIYEFDPLGEIAKTFTREVCKITKLDCSPALWLMTGPNCCIDDESFNRMLEHLPQPVSIKTLIHFTQNIRGGSIQKFDYGPDGNMKKYKQERAPEYDMTKIPKDFPLFLAYGAMDGLADIVDVMRLIGDLKDHDEDKLVKSFQLGYSHMDYQLSYAAIETVYDPVVKFFKSN